MTESADNAARCQNVSREIREKTKHRHRGENESERRNVKVRPCERNDYTVRRPIRGRNVM